MATTNQIARNRKGGFRPGNHIHYVIEHVLVAWLNRKRREKKQLWMKDSKFVRNETD